MRAVMTRENTHTVDGDDSARGASSMASKSSSTSGTASCLCREVLAQTALDAARNVDPAAQHYASFHCAIVEDILDSTSGAHEAFGKSHWIDGNSNLLDGSTAPSRVCDLGALVVMDRGAVTGEAGRRGVITDEELAQSAANDAIIGIFSERDYLNAVARGVVDASTTVRDVMPPPPTTRRRRSQSTDLRLRASDSVLAAMETMTKHRLRHVPVIASEGIDPVNGVHDQTSRARRREHRRSEKTLLANREAKSITSSHHSRLE